MKTAITITNLSKQYKIISSEPYLSLRDVIVQRVKKLGKNNSQPEAFWALKDINLEVKEGERVGIIGHNGAGKSTLLKVISRITPPTNGKITLNGRVASLLEVGTGFHPELTGRENIYLNGSILGLKKIEIDRKLDEIIDFSGVERFIDTPLKHFSSGMQLRLAFSVAANLEPEILLIDEVLAVGDMEFQKKCIGKMEDVSINKGKTILFVSHNLGFVQNFCNKTVLMDKGQMILFDQTANVIHTFLKKIELKLTFSKKVGNGAVQLIDLKIIHSSLVTDYIFLGYPIDINLKFKALRKLNNIELAFNFKDSKNELISHVTSLDKQIIIKANENEIITATIHLKNINFTPGLYTIDVFVMNNDELCWGCYEYTEFIVLNSDLALRPNGFPAHVKCFTDSIWHIDNENI